MCIQYCDWLHDVILIVLASYAPTKGCWNKHERLQYLNLTQVYTLSLFFLLEGSHICMFVRECYKNTFLMEINATAVTVYAFFSWCTVFYISLFYSFPLRPRCCRGIRVYLLSYLGHLKKNHSLYFRPIHVYRNCLKPSEPQCFNLFSVKKSVCNIFYCIKATYRTEKHSCQRH